MYMLLDIGIDGGDWGRDCTAKLNGGFAFTECWEKYSPWRFLGISVIRFCCFRCCYVSFWLDDSSWVGVPGLGLGGTRVVSRYGPMGLFMFDFMLYFVVIWLSSLLLLFWLFFYYYFNPLMIELFNFSSLLLLSFNELIGVLLRSLISYFFNFLAVSP